MRIAIIGAGIAGLTCALEFARRGAAVEVYERAPAGQVHGCSWFAGGMLAPWCEAENSGSLIAALGEESLPWWRTHFPRSSWNGTLVVAHPRDRAELAQFGRRTAHFERLESTAISALEPELAGRFSDALYFASEGHLDPRAALTALGARLSELSVPLHYGAAGPSGRTAGRLVIDCSGLSARVTLPQLRGVKGEMLILRQREVHLSRPVRVLHPRLPVYVVPRADGVYMVGATMLESDAATGVSARSALELLSAAYALHPAFGEAEVLELGSAVRPAFADNLPRLTWVGPVLHVNGLYRHGFLIAPALARRAAEVVLEGRHFAEVMDENPGQRLLA
jgi:glycine oxidase